MCEWRNAGADTRPHRDCLSLPVCCNTNQVGLSIFLSPPAYLRVLPAGAQLTPWRTANIKVFPAAAAGLTVSAAASAACRNSSGTVGAEIDASSGQLLEATAGAPFSFFVQLRTAAGLDAAGVPGNADLVVTPYPAGAVLVSRATPAAARGAVAVTLTPTRAGNVTVSVALNGTEVSNSGFVVSVLPGRSSAAHAGVCLVPRVMRVGVPTRVQVISRDAFGNLLNYSPLVGPDPYRAYLAPGHDQSAQVQGVVRKEPGDGYTYGVTLTAQAAGESTVTILLYGDTVASAAVDVRNGPLDSGRTALMAETASGLVYHSAAEMASARFVAGEAITLTILPEDAAGNAHTWPPLDFGVALSLVAGEAGALPGAAGSSTTALVPPVSRAAPYSASYTLFVAGTYALSVTEAAEAGGQPVAPPLLITVFGGYADPSNSVVSGPGVSSGVAGPDQVEFTVEMRDAYGNLADPSADPPPETPAVMVTAEALDGYSGPYSPEVTEVGYDGGRFTFAYRRLMPGRYTVEVAAADGLGAGSGDDVSQRFEVDVAPSRAPTVVMAELGNDLASVRITFDQETDQGGLAGEFDCTAVLDDATVALLGSGAVCAWASAEEAAEFPYLQIRLGFGATATPRTVLAPASLISLKPGVIRASWGNSYFASGGARLAAPPAPQRPAARLSAPAAVGICDGFVADASGSTGSGPRDWLSVGYSIDSISDTTRAAAILADAAAAGRLLVNLPPGSLDPGGVYNVSVRVTNFLGDSDDAWTLVTQRQARARCLPPSGAPLRTHCVACP